MLRKGDPVEAHRAFAEAVELHGGEGELHAFLGWSRYQMDPRDEAGHEQALREVERGIQLNPRSERAHLFAGCGLNRRQAAIFRYFDIEVEAEQTMAAPTRIQTYIHPEAARHAASRGSVLAG